MRTKLLVISLILVFSLTLGVGFAAAAGDNPLYPGGRGGPGGYGPGNGTGNADRPMDGTGYGPGSGENFVDENGDGICDHFAEGGQDLGYGRGKQMGFGQWAQNGGGFGIGGSMFVDANGNGVCDYQE